MGFHPYRLSGRKRGRLPPASTDLPNEHPEPDEYEMYFAASSPQISTNEYKTVYRMHSESELALKADINATLYIYINMTLFGYNVIDALCHETCKV